MKKSNAVTRLLYSTGGFCTAVGVSALETLEDENCHYEDHLLLFSVDANPQYREASERQAGKLHDFKSIRHLDQFILDPRLNTIDEAQFSSAYSGVDFGEVVVFAESSGIRFDTFVKAFRDAKIIVYEEGMLGYCGRLFHNSKTGGVSTIDRFLSTNYFNKLQPQAFKDKDTLIKKLNIDILREKLHNSAEITAENVGNRSEATALLCTAPLWRFGNISIEDTLEAHFNLVDMLLNSGLTVYFKDHPRPTFRLFRSIFAKMDADKRERLIDVSGISDTAEVLVDILSPTITVGFGSTVLFNSYEIYGVPSFRYKTELVPASLGYAPQHVVNAALKIRYIPDVAKILQVNAEEETHDSYAAIAMGIFEGNLKKRTNSFDDPIIQRVATRLGVGGWPRPKSPTQVLDYIYLNDDDVARRLRSVRKVLMQVDRKTTIVGMIYNSALSAAGKFVDIIGDATGLRVVRAKRINKLKRDAADLEEKYQTCLADFESKKLDLVALRQELAKRKKFDLSSTNWRPYKAVPVMNGSWGEFVRGVAYNDALDRCDNLCRDMDAISCFTARLVVEDAYMVNWNSDNGEAIRISVDFLKNRSQIDFSKQDLLSEEALERVSGGGSVNMGAVRQSLAYAHGLHELLPEVTGKLAGRDVIDGGAYAGDSAFAFLDYSPRRIMCFEPAEESHVILSKNIERSKKSDIIIPLKLGLSDKSSKGILTQNKRAGNHLIEIEEMVEPDNSDVIDLTTIDKIAEDEKLDVGLIKLDVEGHEQAVLEGALETIGKFKPILLISIYHKAEDFFDIKDILARLDLGYEFRIRKFSYNPIMETILVAIPSDLKARTKIH